MIDVAIDAARQAGVLAYNNFKKQQKVSYKADNSPVTPTDIAAERIIRKIITKKFPDHGIIGEEFGSTNPKSLPAGRQAKYQWVIDPIDGTKQFVRGIPFWTTLLAVLENGRPIIGISYSPPRNEFLVAQKDKGTYLNNRRVHVSKISNLKLASLAHSSIIPFEKKGKLRGFLNLCRSVHSHRGYGDSLGYHLLITGKTDIMVEAKDEIYDIAAPALLVEEAGGKFTNFDGEFSITSGVAVATNGLLHEAVLKNLNS